MHSFMKTYLKVTADYNRKQREWLDTIKWLGAKAAHYDDGWVNREKNEIHFCYPFFMYNVAMGDKIVLGDCRKWRVVKVTYIKNGAFVTKYGFKDTSKFLGAKDETK